MQNGRRWGARFGQVRLKVPQLRQVASAGAVTRKSCPCTAMCNRPLRRMAKSLPQQRQRQSEGVRGRLGWRWVSDREGRKAIGGSFEREPFQ